jgi:SAM-dependent methyltransferase
LIRRSPNIWDNPAVYEVENLAFDTAGLVERRMLALGDWAGRHVLDIGCGTGFHLPWFAATASSVTGVEPHPPLAAIARRRTRRQVNISVLDGEASRLPVPEGSIDVAHARWAYFFGPGSEPGLAELERVLRPGGVAFVIDNDPTTSTFGGWFRRGFPEVDPVVVERFWTERGWTREPLLTRWDFGSRDDFEAVVRIELPTAVAEEVLREHPEVTGTDYAINLWWRRF